MKKFIVALLTGAMVLGLTACGGSSGASSNSGGAGSTGSGAAAASGDVIRIGVFEPSTGDSASGGKKETLGMQYAKAAAHSRSRRQDLPGRAGLR